MALLCDRSKLHDDGKILECRIDTQGKAGEG
jgi:hypothetical protein